MFRVIALLTNKIDIRLFIMVIDIARNKVGVFKFSRLSSDFAGILHSI